jgi:hypothetical protein
MFQKAAGRQISKNCPSKCLCGFASSGQGSYFSVKSSVAGFQFTSMKINTGGAFSFSIGVWL